MSDVFDRARALDPRQSAERLGVVFDRSGHAPCPFCGGSDRFYLHGSGRFGCRGCGFKGDAAALAAKVRNVSPVEAARWLLGEETPSRSRAGVGRLAGTLPPVSVAHRGPKVRKRTPEWVEEALRVVERAEKAFGGSPAEAYMAERGLEGACAEYRIGYDPKAWDPVGKLGRPAVVVPSLDRDGRPLAVKYRYLDELGRTDKGRRFGALKGSTPLLFGLHALRDRTLLVVIEGEMNALAVWIALAACADVLSTGSQKVGEAALKVLRDMAAKYSEVIVWADEPEAAKDIGKAIGSSELKRSPRGLDANDVLTRYGSEGVLRVLGKWTLAELDGFDPYADDGSPERSAELLLARLRLHGTPPKRDSSGRIRVPRCPEYLREDVLANLDELARMLRLERG